MSTEPNVASDGANSQGTDPDARHGGPTGDGTMRSAHTEPSIRHGGPSARDGATHPSRTAPVVRHGEPTGDGTMRSAHTEPSIRRDGLSSQAADPSVRRGGTRPHGAAPGVRRGAEGSLTADLRLAWLLTRGSDRREWWRVGLTAVGAALATGFALAAVSLAALQGRYSVSVGAGLLDDPGTRSGVIVVLLLLLIPVLGFLGQCARIGAVHRDRRLAGLRLAGASAGQVRRIAALETGLACLLGSVLATVVSVVVLLSEWAHPTALAWAGIALIGLGVPVLGAAAGVLALRRVVASPLGWVRRVRSRSGRGIGWLFVGGVVLVAAVALAAVAGTSTGVPDGGGVSYAEGPLTVAGALLVVGAGAVWLLGVASRQLGEGLAARARRPALLIAAERLRDDPWAAARTHAAVLLVTVVGTGFVGIRQVLLAELNSRNPDELAASMTYYTTGVDLTGAAILVALAITLSALAVGTVESLATRRRGLAAQAAAGVPYGVLSRAMLLETALPLAPAVAVAGLGGTGIGAWYASLTGTEGIPLGTLGLTLLVPVVVYAACLLAAATSLPLLRRSVNPAELRYA